MGHSYYSWSSGHDGQLDGLDIRDIWDIAIIHGPVYKMDGLDIRDIRDIWVLAIIHGTVDMIDSWTDWTLGTFGSYLLFMVQWI